MGNSYSVGTPATRVQGAVHCLYDSACVPACVRVRYKEKEKRQKTKQKLGHLHGTDTSPCKQIFENVRVWQGKKPQAMKKKQQQQQMAAQIVRMATPCTSVTPLTSLGWMCTRQVGGGGDGGDGKGVGQRSRLLFAASACGGWTLILWP